MMILKVLPVFGVSFNVSSEFVIESCEDVPKLIKLACANFLKAFLGSL